MIESLSSLGILGSIALIAGILYVWLASRTTYSAWYFGIVSCSIIAYEDFTLYNLLADGVLQSFYVVMGIVALISWKNVDEMGRLQIQVRPIKWHVLTSVALGSISIIIGMLVKFYTVANLPLLDTLTSVFAIFATWLLVNRDKSNWLYWIVINLIYIYIYGAQGAWFYVSLSLIYGGMSVYGWFHWQRIHREELLGLGA